MSPVRLFVTTLALFTSVLVGAPAFAQCTYGGEQLADGTSPPGEPCVICRGTEMEPLPRHTVCGEDRFQCDGTKIQREECDGQGACDFVERETPCPGGFVCAEDGSPRYCLRECTTDDQCRDQFTCGDGGTCEAPDPPDMGSTGEVDMGGPIDMGKDDPDLGTTGKDDAGAGDAGTGKDASLSPDSGSEPKTSSGCAVVPGGPSESPLAVAVMALAALLFLRRQ